MNPELQAIFDKTLNHLRIQKEKSYNTRQLSCMYHNKEGLKCAVGIHIPDEVYDPAMEGESVNTILRKFPILFTLDAFNTNTKIDLLREMQVIHDTFKCENWEMHFKNLANECRLTYVPA